MTKFFALILLASQISIAAQAQAEIRRGNIVGSEDVAIGKRLSSVAVATNAGNDSARLYVDRQEIDGALADGVASGYASKPMIYFYYEINLKPNTRADGRVVLYSAEELTTASRASGSTFARGAIFCPLEANAVLTSYKGNGTSKRECVKLADPVPAQ